MNNFDRYIIKTDNFPTPGDIPGVVRVYMGSSPSTIPQHTFLKYTDVADLVSSLRLRLEDADEREAHRIKEIASLNAALTQRNADVACRTQERVATEAVLNSRVAASAEEVTHLQGQVEEGEAAYAALVASVADQKALLDATFATNSELQNGMAISKKMYLELQEQYAALDDTREKEFAELQVCLEQLDEYKKDLLEAGPSVHAAVVAENAKLREQAIALQTSCNEFIVAISSNMPPVVSQVPLHPRVLPDDELVAGAVALANTLGVPLGVGGIQLALAVSRMAIRMAAA
jgi:chromosome segregation ATPase